MARLLLGIFVKNVIQQMHGYHASLRGT